MIQILSAMQSTSDWGFSSKPPLQRASPGWSTAWSGTSNLLIICNLSMKEYCD